MKIVIIGGVAAGSKAAAKLRKLLPCAQIELYTEDTHISYSSCGLPYFVEGNFDDYRMLLVRLPEEFEKDGIAIHLQNKVLKIIPEYKQLLISDYKNKNLFLTEYDKLVIATGASPIIPEIENIDLKNVFTLRNIEDGILLKEKVLNSKKAVIIGSGYIGIELLEAFVKQGLKVSVIERSGSIMPNLDEDMSLLIREQLESISNGRFVFYTNEIVEKFAGNNGVKQVITSSNKVIDTDFVLIATGVKPNIKIAQDAGIKLGKTGAIKVDCHMRTNIEDIYACGDCIEKNLLISNTPTYIPLGSYASKEGRCAAINIAGQNDCFPGVLGSAVTRCLKFTISMTGLTVKKAQQLGYNPVWATVTKNDKVGYMPDVSNITLKLVADESSGILLGAQAIGSIEADKKINSLTAALTGKMTVMQLLENDTTYAPPYSTTIDLLFNAAEILLKKVK
ncbi:MAG: FAD-dependent oxidoreductase [Clostridiaceae bacterium]|jgi:NADPH-dependent 2,4-dienoyl-CoA reductase/sulfur reductase-like enzyme|nr:FAD-dependent oxidoreductase [Clostridiaceae bacterium]